MRITSTGLSFAAILTGLVGCGEGSVEKSNEPSAADREASSLERVTHEIDAEKGRSLFVQKGCVICHSVNGVGGKAAPPMDAEIGAPPIDPLDFAARMWRGAPAMIELQSLELGYTIHLTADEIANLAAFAGDIAEQRKFSIEEVPEMIRDSLLDERFWEVEDWDEFLRNGQEGYDPAPPEEMLSDQASEPEPEPSPEP